MSLKLDPLIIAKLSTMSMKAKFVVEGFVSGLHSSKFKGHSLEFAQHREYSTGDELRHIDWRVYGKSDRFFIKQYEEETNLKCYILLDKSASMKYKSNDISKLEYASYIAASLSYLMIKQGDSVGLGLFDSEIKQIIPPRSTTEHLSVILEKLSSFEGEGETDISKMLSGFSKYLKKRGLIIIISDLMDNQENVVRAIKSFRFKKHEVIVFQVFDKMEESLDYIGNIMFKGMELNNTLMTEPEIIRVEYKKLISAFIEKYKQEFTKADIDYAYFNTSMPLDYALSKYLSKREKLLD